MRYLEARGAAWVGGIAVALLVLGASGATAQRDQSQPRAEIYGHVMLDMGYQTGRNHPDWFDVVRPTKLPSSDTEFGQDGRWFSGVRQSRLGVRTYHPTDLGELKTTFEFELFGVGPDAGQTTFRLRHAYGELGKFGAGQTWSPFMDIDVFPNTLEYWGPTGMVFFRNVQARWMPIQGDTRLTVAVERPGASGDPGEIRSGPAEPELAGLQARFPAPDLSAEYRLGRTWGYVEVAAILRYINWDDNQVLAGENDLSGDGVGWGVNLSSNLKVGEKGTVRGQVVYGEAIENYMNDAPADVGAVQTSATPLIYEGELLPVLGVVAFYDHSWNAKWSSSVGYSLIDIDNAQGQLSDAFSEGHYGIVNLLHYPAKNLMVGTELQYGRRVNFDGWDVDDMRVQFSAKYNFSYGLGG